MADREQAIADVTSPGNEYYLYYSDHGFLSLARRFVGAPNGIAWEIAGDSACPEMYYGEEWADGRQLWRIAPPGVDIVTRRAIEFSAEWNAAERRHGISSALPEDYSGTLTRVLDGDGLPEASALAAVRVAFERAAHADGPKPERLFSYWRGICRGMTAGQAWGGRRG